MPDRPARTRKLVLNIEDDRDIALLIRTLLERAGFTVASVADGREGLRRFHADRPDLVILDLGLPTLDGWTLIERLRELSAVPILVLTARGSEPDKVRGLRSGADDYLTKPFGNAELLARVEALLRRDAAGRNSAARGSSPTVVRKHDVEIDFPARTVRKAGQVIELTPTEFRLLETLVRHEGKVLSLEQLLHTAWRDPTATGPDRVKFTVLRLRRKLGWETNGDCPIETIRGFGYRFRADSPGRPASPAGRN
jgi:DNA-binding response OmpR family regulator